MPSFAARWIAENETGRPEYEARRKAEREHPIEAVGAVLRGMMPFLDAVTIAPEPQAQRPGQAA